ncbi:hypothetical protein POJ06DRAFT_25751 [Lipomyces tetrasporus]|uniref:Guanine nucleotide exchange factor Vps9 n=1 Tax=Lipomyces tetrasporus TaxID=54092 RepID=A0AAD7QMX6_9ASCO|nr:uncharacterized protein POJ06DRAFT_25751 [Lipomyces tetrasporus]KAJ8097950.1 hypothetical protein POJ06DRAFT_25751 [Lipomyces tetrasporus]
MSALESPAPSPALYADKSVADDSTGAPPAESSLAPSSLDSSSVAGLTLSDSSEMVSLATTPRDDDLPAPSPMPTPQPMIGKPSLNLQSILEQFDPLALQSNSEERARPQSRSSGNSTPFTLSRSSSTGSTTSKSVNGMKMPLLTRTFSKQATKPTTSQATTLVPKRRDKQQSSSSRMAAVQANQQSDLPKPEDQPAELPFDFQRFLNQLRHKGADPLSRYLKSFLHEFGKRSWTVREQVKIVQDFQNFIAPRIPLYPPFSTLPETEIANALEGMEKLIMNRLYAQTFSPEIPRSRRTFSHEEDLLRDNVLAEKMRIWSWIEADHLDVEKAILDSGERFILLAEDELLKINNYRAPRDKIICILNCCKVIFGLLRQTKTEESADRFLPILIYVVIKAQPRHLVSNVQYIMRFRCPDKLSGEAGYYLSSLQGAISFIETLDRNSLNITDEEFEERVVQSVAMIQEKADRSIELSDTPTSPVTPTSPASLRMRTQTPPSRPFSPADMADVASGVASQVQEALSATFTAPFKQFSKLFDSDDTDEEEHKQSIISRTRNFARRASSTSQQARTQSPQQQTSNDHQRSVSSSSQSDPSATAARQASEEAREAKRIEQQEHKDVVETLYQMFPNLDMDVIEDVVTQKQGRVGLAVDACLALAQE